MCVCVRERASERERERKDGPRVCSKRALPEHKMELDAESHSSYATERNKFTGRSSKRNLKRGY